MYLFFPQWHCGVSHRVLLQAALRASGKGEKQALPAIMSPADANSFVAAYNEMVSSRETLEATLVEAEEDADLRRRIINTQ